MNFLHTEIGSAKDNQKSPVHNWYKFTAGFSHKFVEEIINLENLKRKKTSEIFDPFAGCGTTLVSAQKDGVRAVGNEGQEFMYDVIRAKLNWKLDDRTFREYLALIEKTVDDQQPEFDLASAAHPLLITLYSRPILKELYLIRNKVWEIKSSKYRLFFQLALSQTLHKVSKHPIAVPYIVRSKSLKNENSAWETFSGICNSMFDDTQSLMDKMTTSKIYKHDSRKENRFIDDRQCNICISSPPYLNNLDYGEVSKVHTHFFEITENWGDITQKVRKKLVTGSTTHYTESSFDLDDFRNTDFALSNQAVLDRLIRKSNKIKREADERSGKKSFDILTLLYFEDMYRVLKEIKRVLKRNSKAYLILGDSAPYGIRIPTTEILGNISMSVGFADYKIHKIRKRGTKWTTLTHRHSLELTENVLILK